MKTGYRTNAFKNDGHDPGLWEKFRGTGETIAGWLIVLGLLFMLYAGVKWLYVSASTERTERAAAREHAVQQREDNIAARERRVAEKEMSLGGVCSDRALTMSTSGGWWAQCGFDQDGTITPGANGENFLVCRCRRPATSVETPKKAPEPGPEP